MLGFAQKCMTRYTILTFIQQRQAKQTNPAQDIAVRKQL